MYGTIQPVKIESPLNMLAQISQLKAQQNQNRLADLTFAQHQRSLDSDNALASLLADPKAKPEDVAQGLAAKGYGNAALAYTKQNADLQKAQADIGKTKADTSKSNAEALVKAAAAHRDELWSVNDPQAAAEWLKAGYADPITGPVLQRQMPIEAAISRIPTDPAAFQQWRQQAALGATEFIKRNTVDANTAATNATSRANNAATNATSRANNAATISKDLLIAGFDKNGNPTGDMETTARAIASGQLPPPSGMALTNPKNQRILSRVMEINPQYDFTDVTAKKKAASDFTTGTQGNAMRSFAVASQHLDQLNQLVDALDNGNVQIVNKVKNAYQAQTGQTAPTNFDAAKGVVAKEVINAIVAGGSSGVDERKELESQLSNAKSPAQLKGVINQWTDLMQAKHSALLQQRRAAGLPDSTLPKYSTSDGSAKPPSAVPANVQSLLDKYK
jgi:hypothetical protein